MAEGTNRRAFRVGGCHGSERHPQAEARGVRSRPNGRGAVSPFGHPSPSRSRTKPGGFWVLGPSETGSHGFPSPPPSVQSRDRDPTFLVTVCFPVVPHALARSVDHAPPSRTTNRERAGPVTRRGWLDGLRDGKASPRPGEGLLLRKAGGRGGSCEGGEGQVPPAALRLCDEFSIGAGAGRLTLACSHMYLVLRLLLLIPW